MYSPLSRQASSSMNRGKRHGGAVTVISMRSQLRLLSIIFSCFVIASEGYRDLEYVVHVLTGFFLLLCGTIRHSDPPLLSCSVLSLLLLLAWCIGVVEGEDRGAKG